MAALRLKRPPANLKFEQGGAAVLNTDYSNFFHLSRSVKLSQESAAAPSGCSRRPWLDAAFPCRSLAGSSRHQAGNETQNA